MVIRLTPEYHALETYDCLVTGWTNVLIVYYCLIARYRCWKTRLWVRYKCFATSRCTSPVQDLLFLYTLHDSIPWHSGLFIHEGSFRIFTFTGVLRINLCDALYSEKLEWRYLIHDDMNNDHNYLSCSMSHKVSFCVTLNIVQTLQRA
jgi:hypothetical protein